MGFNLYDEVDRSGRDEARHHFPTLADEAYEDRKAEARRDAILDAQDEEARARGEW